MSAMMTPLASAYATDAAGWAQLLGWRYPVAFTDTVAEHHAVRRNAGVFDFSFMTHLAVRGPQAQAFVQRLITNDVSGLVPGRIVYSPLCDEAGGMVDDCTVIRRDDDWLVTTGLCSTVGWVQAQARGFDVILDDCSSRLAVVAVQGPASFDVLAALGIGQAASLAYYSTADASYDGAPLLLARLGYTAELGFELLAPVRVARPLWRRLVQLAAPCGAGALETLRIEAGLLERFVRPDQGDFTGRAALIARARPAQRLAGLRFDGGTVPPRGARAVEAVPLPFYDPDRRRARARVRAGAPTVA